MLYSGLHVVGPFDLINTKLCPVTEESWLNVISGTDIFDKRVLLWGVGEIQCHGVTFGSDFQIVQTGYYGYQ